MCVCVCVQLLSILNDFNSEVKFITFINNNELFFA